MSRRHKIPAPIERAALYTIIGLLGLGLVLLMVGAYDQANTSIIGSLGIY